MILARLDQADRYAALHPAFADALAWLRATDLAALPLGRVGLGHGVEAIVTDAPGRGQQPAKLEVHRQTIDIQFCVSGNDIIGWRPAADLHLRASDYDPSADVETFYDEALCWQPLPEGCLAILWPEDGHAPLGCPAGTPLLKVVVKVPVRDGHPQPLRLLR
ncbi:MAG: YhcH/YjgK/YiaL family protein [Armatimonadetes bacterium]|nr:YhcH/YjgK/YiaL family protein [Armatimonadota bacterium]